MVPFDQPSPKARVPTWPSLALQHSTNKMRMIYNYIYSSYYSAYNAKNVEFDRFDFKFCSFLTFNKGVKHIISKFLIYIIYFILIHCLAWIYWEALILIYIIYSLEIPCVFWSHLILKFQKKYIYIHTQTYISSYSMYHSLKPHLFSQFRRLALGFNLFIENYLIMPCDWWFI